jgi:hypothetical protein
MLNVRIPTARSQTLIGFGFFILSMFLAWGIGLKIADDDFRFLAYVALVLAGGVVAITALRNWRTGFYMFLIWLMFEDLVRKYMGNGLALFFGKDILLGLVYLSLFIAVRSGREKTFRPPFFLFLSLFFWLGVVQVFNQNSPSIWFGLLGIKVYFYYFPLLFVGYALVRNDVDLRKFLMANALLAIAISFLGVTQAILGNSFLNPRNLAPELETLGNLEKSTATGQSFNLPDSVFVSSGRYAQYLAIAFILAMGAAGYLLLHTKRNRKWMFTVIGLLGVATLLSGNRGSIVSMLMTAVLLSMGFLWGASWKNQQAHRTIKAIRWSVIVAILGLVVIFALFPREAGSRLEFYTETLLPSSTDYQLGNRIWEYPIVNFLATFSQPNWMMGNGIGTASLGTQYVTMLTGKPALGIGVEEGYGSMILEMGIVAPFLWILWTASLLYYSWKVICCLRETRLFPIALAIGWYAFLLLYPWTYASLAGYENYTCNAFLWLLVGILFRLPDLLVNAPSPPVAQTGLHHARDWFQYRRRIRTAT